MSPAANRKGDRLIVGGVPRAELLPPELELEKKARSQRRGLVTVFILVVILVAAAYGAVALAAAGTQIALAAETERSAELLAAQNEYIEVRQLAAQVAASQSARQIGTSTEIDWQSFVYDMYRQTPSDLAIVKLTMTSATPISPFSETVVPLEQPRVAELLIEGEASTYGPQAEFLRGLENLDGFSDASLETVTFEDGVYKFAIRLHINQDAYSNRFASEDNQG